VIFRASFHGLLYILYGAFNLTFLVPEESIMVNGD
jgi:hypothetical protein